MSLTWFPFYTEAYTGDTSHLTCEEHGAYLLLMLAYYRSEKPLPARDRSLAAACKLSLDAWMEARHSLAPFFREQDGFWFHDVIEKTIAIQHSRYNARVARFKVLDSRRPPPVEWANIRLRIFKRDDFTCQYCSARGVSLECDHKIPICQGGSSNDDNLVTACYSCNRDKGARTVEQWKAAS